MTFKGPKQTFRNYCGGRQRRLLRRCMLLLLLVFSIEAVSQAQSELSPAVERSTVDSLPAKIRLAEGNDIRFQRLSADAGLSQTRVNSVVQDKLGFIWFGTQYGLDRFDGYRVKVFKQEPGRPGSLSCVYVRSLLVDRAGTLWVGCDRFLDRFEPVTETFAHYRIDMDSSDQLSVPIERITEDRAGKLWLATDNGLYRFDPDTGRTIRYFHEPRDPASIASTRVHDAEVDREGRFWVASDAGLEEFDRKTGKVVRRLPLQAKINSFHEDKFGIFWIAVGNQACGLATWNPQTNVVKCHSLLFRMRGTTFKALVSAILEDRNDTLWFSSTGGLLKLDRVHNTIVRYHNNPLDAESLESDSLIYLYEDHEGNIWTCFQATEPNFFSERPPPFEAFTYQRGVLLDPLVTSIYEDHHGILWIGSMGGLNRIDRRSGTNIAVPRINNEIMTMIENPQGVLLAGTFQKGLERIDPETGKRTPYSTWSANHYSDIMRLIYDREGNLWAAEYGGLGRFDPTTGGFTMYAPDNRRMVHFQEVKEDRHGFIWLGAQEGLYRFDPRTTRFRLYEHQTDEPSSLSDDRVNSIYFNHRGTLWLGTQNGLDRFDPATGTFRNYYEKDGLAGDVVSCILADKHGVLWMSTNNGLSSFDPQSQKFQNFSTADGLSGQDLTGWGACYQSPSGEMFFGGFGGATAFHPSRIVKSSFVPKVVLTDFRLWGDPVPIGSGSPLKQSITYTHFIRLSHRQNMFSIEFSALSFFNAETNRYRYKLDGFDRSWHQVGSDQRIASYTTLPAGSYTFEVQGATARGPWSEPGVRLRIEILPAWYQTVWFRILLAAAFLGFLWTLYHLRIWKLREREKKLREVIATIPTFAWTASPDGIVDFLNRHYEDYTGIPVEKAVGSAWTAVVHPEDLERHIEKFRSAMATGDLFEIESRFRRADGQYRWFLTRAVPLRDSRGRITRWYGTSIEIEDRKRAEQLRADFAHISRANTMSQLTASLTHEIKQPIGAAVTNAEACLRLLKRSEPNVPEACEAALEMTKDARRAADIVDRVRSLYQKGGSRLEPVSVNEVVAEMLTMLRNQANQHSVRMRADLAEGLPTVMADRVQLQQVLMNLILNGIEAMKDTDGDLSIRSQLSADGALLISVTDNGMGLPAGRENEIFNAFFTTKSQGTGLGLAITRSILESHGGRVWATANADRGTTFFFTLPIRTTVSA
jgi:PAS domain S-box-containing protein